MVFAFPFLNIERWKEQIFCLKSLGQFLVNPLLWENSTTHCDSIQPQNQPKLLRIRRTKYIFAKKSTLTIPIFVRLLEHLLDLVGWKISEAVRDVQCGAGLYSKNIHLVEANLFTDQNHAFLSNSAPFKCHF